MTDRTVLTDIADGWHLCVLAGLTHPTATTATEAAAALLATAALLHGHRRPALTLTATATAGHLAAALLL
ncbi:hypothetical protein [Streptomyces sp. NPDC020607]|uniref:hypothetical protein n=1 Tax=Streptomyces sp. NPDC020607 TaxID=3365082 RepID=UPI003792C2D2